MESISASKFLKLLYRLVKKPPFLKLSACVTFYFLPKGHIAGKPFRCFPYLKLRASLNSPLFGAKPNFTKGNTPSYKDAPDILASCIAFKVWGVWSYFTFKARSEMGTSFLFLILRFVYDFMILRFHLSQSCLEVCYPVLTWL